MNISTQLQADLSGDDIMRENRSCDGCDPQEASHCDALRTQVSDNARAKTESLAELGNRKKTAPRDAGHS